jgi:hypothetical protein
MVVLEGVVEVESARKEVLRVHYSLAHWLEVER